MKIETLLNILFANGHEDIVALAVKIDNNIVDNTPPVTEIPVSVYKSDLPSGMAFAGGENHSATVLCEVVAQPNPYKTKKLYWVKLPNGIIAEKERSTNTVKQIVPIQVTPTEEV